MSTIALYAWNRVHSRRIQVKYSAYGCCQVSGLDSRMLSLKLRSYGPCVRQLWSR